MLDFRLLYSLPKPKKTTFVCLLTFCCLACLYWHELPITADLKGSVHDFLRQERGAHPKHPQVFVAGSSLSGHGFHVEELENRLRMPVAKVALDGGSIQDVIDILDCYSDESRHVNLLFIDQMALVSSTQAAERKQIFDAARGDSTVTSFLQRRSMSYFLWSCREAKRRYWSHWQGIANTSPARAFERNWYDPRYKKAREQNRIQLQAHAEQVRKNRENSTTGTWDIPENQIEIIYRLLDLCRVRNIFVVVCMTPQWYGKLNITQEDLDNPTEMQFLLLLQDINQRSDCSVIICRDFEEITSEGADEDYLFDYGHMTKAGAIVYSNWLVDRLLETPKTAEAIRQRQK